ncbi:hypothetical protein L596_011629 [Steinernema carpocapsae]|uniref:Uncharacterized protein n=1 Tax=Steinernema carpocapsae TaxID=34508 RepID=A0A4V6A4K1_STECR|nr:hypothetical protein L596_011629 [Steinernema carpocapsae]
MLFKFDQSLKVEANGKCLIRNKRPSMEFFKAAIGFIQYRDHPARLHLNSTEVKIADRRPLNASIVAWPKSGHPVGWIVTLEIERAMAVRFNENPKEYFVNLKNRTKWKVPFEQEYYDPKVFPEFDQYASFEERKRKRQSELSVVGPATNSKYR